MHFDTFPSSKFIGFVSENVNNRAQSIQYKYMGAGFFIFIVLDAYFLSVPLRP